MTKGRIISALILISALAISGSLYKFYFAAKLQRYEDDAALKAALEDKSIEVERAFHKTDPTLIIAQWEDAQPRFKVTRDRRGSFFNFSDWEEHPIYEPTDGIVKYWYEEEATAMVDALRQKAIEKRIMSPAIMQLRSQLMIPDSTMYAGRNVEVEVAHAELRRLSFGIHAAELLLDNNVRGVQKLWLWKPREATELGGLLTYQTMGCIVRITLPDLISFFEDMRASTRYFDVEAIRLIYSSPGAPQEPELTAQFIITQARYTEVNANVAVGNVAAANTGGGYNSAYGPGYDGGRYGTNVVPQKQTLRSKAWRWFKRYILYTN